MRVGAVRRGIFEYEKYYPENVIYVEFADLIAYGPDNERDDGAAIASRISSLSKNNEGKINKVALAGHDPVIWQFDTGFLNLMKYLKKSLFEVYLKTKGNLRIGDHMKEFVDFVCITPDFLKRNSFYERNSFDGYREVPHCFGFVIRSNSDIENVLEFVLDFQLTDEELYFSVEKSLAPGKRTRQEILEQAERLFVNAGINRITKIED